MDSKASTSPSSGLMTDLQRVNEQSILPALMASLNVCHPETQISMQRPAMPPKPLTEFHKFVDLPIEIRMKVWKKLIKQPRLIEIEHDPRIWNQKKRSQFQCPKDHRSWRVAYRSRTTPVVLQINKETREEALKSYVRIRCEQKFASNKWKEVYYNPQIDIIYFGQNACINTIHHAIHRNWVRPRIAIDIRIQTGICCDGQELNTDYATENGYGIDDDISVLQLLHGNGEKSSTSS
jgi:hypothetical protein